MKSYDHIANKASSTLQDYQQQQQLEQARLYNNNIAIQPVAGAVGGTLSAGRIAPIGPVFPVTQAGDVVIRQTRNGFRVIVATYENHEYVAATLDDLADVVKLALVNARLDKAK